MGAHPNFQRKKKDDKLDFFFFFFIAQFRLHSSSIESGFRYRVKWGTIHKKTVKYVHTKLCVSIQSIIDI